MISPNVILPYDSTHASIPAGFTRETSLDGLFPKGTANATNPNDTGGAATHTHTGTAHTHTLTAHTHTGTSGAVVCVDDSTRTTGTTLARMVHTHSFTTGARSGGTSGSTAPTYGAVSNNPPYYDVIFIKSSTYNLIPNNAMVLGSATSRVGLTFHSASADKFLRGANTGANAGGTGGSLTNVHTLSHAHTSTTHNHSNSTSGNCSSMGGNASGSGNSIGQHQHTVTTGNGTQNVTNYTGSLTTTESVQPTYRTLNVFKNQSGNSLMPKVGDIGLWLGTLANIPSGWILCDGSNGTPDMRGRYIKNNASATTSSTGGSNTHTHAAQGHTHTGNGTHSHTVSFNSLSGSLGRADATSILVIATDHYHESVTVSATTNFDSANTAGDSQSNEPQYRTVAYIMLSRDFATGQPLLFMIENNLLR